MSFNRMTNVTLTARDATSAFMYTLLSVDCMYVHEGAGICNGGASVLFNSLDAEFRLRNCSV